MSAAPAIGSEQLAGRCAVVTGSASGIGRAAAELFASHGARVVLSDINPDGAGVADRIVAAGGTACFVQGDVSVEADVERLIDVAVRTYGRVDCAFNNAGITGNHSPFHELDLADWARVLATNQTAIFLCMKHELAHMVSAGGGAIVNTASVAAFTPAPNQPHYTATKHAVVGLTKHAAREYAMSNIRVNAVCPGVTDTPLVQRSLERNPQLRDMLLGALPKGRMARAEEVAHVALWLCSDAASYVSGDSIVVDGGGLCR